MKEWTRAARLAAKERRTAELFAKMKEGQRLKESFRRWRSFAHSLTDNNNSQHMTLAMLRTVASKARVPAMMYAAARGMKDLVLELINEGSPVNMKERGTGSTPLHAAAESGCVSVVEILLEASANPATTDDSGETPLQRVAKKGLEASVDVALALLRHGADPSYVSEKDGRSLLHIAVDAGASLQLVSVLLQYRANVEQQQPTNGRTALHAAAARGHFPVLEAMLKHTRQQSGRSAGIIDDFATKFPKDFIGHTPLHAACASDSPDMPKCIAGLVEAGFDVNARSLSGETTLHTFCQNQSAHPATLELFVPHGLLDAQDMNNNTPLHFACLRQIRGVALELVCRGARLFFVNEGGQCPLDMVPPAFAIRLLAAIRDPPIISHAERAHRNLNHCMICKDPIDVGLFRRRVADHCRRCGRLCCAKCCNYRMKLNWPPIPQQPNPNAGNSPILGSSLEAQPVVSTSDKATKVCQHCAEVLMDTSDFELSGDNV
jgi:ankyrin repeat protein